MIFRSFSWADAEVCPVGSLRSAGERADHHDVNRTSQARHSSICSSHELGVLQESENECDHVTGSVMQETMLYGDGQGGGRDLKGNKVVL